MSLEFFPLTIEELEEIIKGLKVRLEDDSFQEEWVKIHDELMFREQQLKDLTIQNETL
ncbi:hypothetical protein [Chryseobacterium gallinarum]|uniref:hypothetical protein n=1 Tax=Chryseobacterium gallinarum TaxID=1324352 RepID=UPI000B31024B|nr:hypothetical protein [Chryseobacterium gallinarum]